MQCLECKSENREGAKFCSECGHKFELSCPKCGNSVKPQSKFCDECGHKLESPLDASETATDIKSPSPQPTDKIKSGEAASIVGERKHVTVLFSDLTGYTAMSEKLDPEELKGITTRIFGEISKIVGKYDGFIEKYAGDAVMAIFGVPRAHEDDPIRAIKAAREIHREVDAISPEVENKVGQAISMHTGVNTGLVVTGEVNMERGTHGVAGDTINLAARLSSYAESGEILINVDTYRQVEGHFECEYLETATVKGKAEPVQIYRVLSERDDPLTIRRLSGLKADLIGRDVEMAELFEAVEDLRQGKGKIFSICGAAGTGKSRLVNEFKLKLDLNTVRYLEGYAYPYTMNTPYFPLINLLNKALQIDEEDSPVEVKQKITLGINNIISDSKEVLPYIGGLYSISYSEIENVSPEYWKIKLQAAVLSVLSAFSKQGPTVICLEDLHWSDPSFMELIRNVLTESKDAILFICTYRPQVTLFTTHQINNMFNSFKEYRLQDLSPSESQKMVQSLLATDSVPIELKDFIHKMVQGNPFYLEEVVNSLIETKILIKNGNGWSTTQKITEKVISSTIHGVIASRLDRLENETKRLLQEASVIGSAFYYQILKKITLAKENIDRNLSILERLDLIRMKAIEPDLEYIFKHGLTQEVVYNGILKKDREIIHEQIGKVIEQIFKDRLPEFYDALAFHYKHSRIKSNATRYLKLSGEKSLKKYSVDESNQYFNEAYEILTKKDDKSTTKPKELISLLNNWALTHYYLGSFKQIVELFEKHKKEAEMLNDHSLLGMYYIWLGMGLYCRERIKEGDSYLLKALKIGRENDDENVVAYALTWLCWSRADLGRYEDVTNFSLQVRELYNSGLTDEYTYYKATGGESLACYMTGNSRKNKELGNMLLTFGNQKSHIRSLTLGHISDGLSQDSAGNFHLAIENHKKALYVAKDPMYEQYSRIFYAMALMQNDQVDESQKAFKMVSEFCDSNGMEIIGNPAKFFLGFIQILNGEMSKGMNNIEKLLHRWNEIDRGPISTLAYLSLGKLYAQIASGTESVSLKMMIKNVGFLIKNVPMAFKKAEVYLNRAIENAEKMKLKGVHAQSLLGLGMLYKRKGKKEIAIENLQLAIELFAENGNDVYHKQAQYELESI